MGKKKKKRSPYRLVCGLEIHVELKTQSKMFCGCKNDPFFAPEPNIYTCDYCLGRETKAPVPNKKAIEQTIKFGLFTDSKINQQSYFERKHYTYPDVPKGYQISQCTKWFTYDGKISTDDGIVRLAEAHLEEDVAKMIHKEVDGKKVSLIDFNRSGLPLIEIVSQPDIHSSKQAVEYAKSIQAITRYLGIADADMEKGQMRFDANVSLQNLEQQERDELPSYKVEIKNINSFKSLGLALDWEIKRQRELLEAGETVPQETRGFDMETGKTFFQRAKGVLVDFHALRCPDMSGIEISDELLAQWKSELPVRRQVVLADWQREYGVEVKYGWAFVERAESIAWVGKLWTAAKQAGLDVNKLANFLVNKKIEYEIGADVATLVAEFRQLTAVDATDDGEIEGLIVRVLSEQQQEVERFKAGEQQLLGFFMGQIMKAAGKKLDAVQVSKVLRQQLSK